MIYSLYVQCYTESERGWGQRPDGYSLHTSLEGAKKFAKDYIGKMRASEKEAYGDSVPDEYTMADGEPSLMECTKELHDKVVAAGGKMWGDGNWPHKDKDGKLDK